MTIEELYRELVEADHGALDAIERVLAPVYVTLPKNANGKLDHATVCYALHRYFVQQHGWFFNGMSPECSELCSEFGGKLSPGRAAVRAAARVVVRTAAA